MPILSIRLSDTEYKELKCAADKKGLAVSSYVKQKIFPSQQKCQNFLTNEIIMNIIKKKLTNKELLSGDEFVLSELFTNDEYIKYYNFIPAGKAFFKYVTSPDTQAAQFLIPLGGKPAKYRIK